MTAPTTACRGPVSRRSFLEAGSLALGGLGLSDLLRGRAAAKETTGLADDTSVILIWLQGGPSHMETYDLKPEAPIDYRGECNPIATAAPGMDICEHLPMHAQVADKINVIRSISHGFANHAAGAGRFLSGYNPFKLLDPLGQFPCLGPVVSKMLEGRRNPAMPRYVADSSNVYGGGSASLGPAYLPFVVGGDPNAPNFEVKNLSLSPAIKDRLDDRSLLRKAFDGLNREIDQSRVMDSMDKYDREAVSLLTSNKAQNAFDLSQENPKVRDKYGRHKWGQRALLARRLVEAGTSFVTMQMQNPSIPGAIGNWDIHAVNGHLFDDARARLPVFDQAVAALVEDLYQRGLDKKVMLIVSGEFGRTPRINPQKGTASKVLQPGRDHYPGAMSVLVSGGGMQTGQVIGSTTAKGELPKDRKLDPNDLLATIYRFLGIDYAEMVPDNNGRPVPLIPFGTPIRELL
ncbi:hypothetical protein CA54_19220 [Symmachiella macrocystis]|uniref:DUF1501 domain-containing protein n=1 Tax=Symmachiella macrocystis TaxID=2527985 RepID=A0A5C6BPA0_9PLAN|nr:DUF1501 domain-containing protein [Symmachiella macrocystis]TWU13096.1 hypothetical protein CA54_19220 [Symmachiella macrocystis]